MAAKPSLGMFWTSVLSRLLQPSSLSFRNCISCTNALIISFILQRWAPLRRHTQPQPSHTSHLFLPRATTPSSLQGHHSQICLELALDTVLERHSFDHGKVVSSTHPLTLFEMAVERTPGFQDARHLGNKPVPKTPYFWSENHVEHPTYIQRRTPR